MRGRPKKSRHRSVRLPERFGPIRSGVPRGSSSSRGRRSPLGGTRVDEALHLRHSLKSSPEFSPPPVCLGASALRRHCGRAASPSARVLCASRGHHRNIDSATIRPDAASINNYFAQRCTSSPHRASNVSPGDGDLMQKQPLSLTEMAHLFFRSGMVLCLVEVPRGCRPNLPVWFPGETPNPVVLPQFRGGCVSIILQNAPQSFTKR